MIKLDSFETKTRIITDNWSDIQLYATDAHTGKIVGVATTSFATSASTMKNYPHATKEKASRDIDNLKRYLIDKNIKTEHEWATNAEPMAKMKFIGCFSMPRPEFSHE